LEHHRETLENTGLETPKVTAIGKCNKLTYTPLVRSYAGQNPPAKNYNPYAAG
jgi:hypothetical protein